MSLLAQIAQVEAKIQHQQSQIPGIIASRDSWQASAIKTICNQKLKKKREACQKDKQMKLDKVRDRNNVLSNVRKTIARLEKEKAALIKQQDAESAATKILAQSGETKDSVKTKAAAEAMAIQTRASLEAEEDQKMSKTIRYSAVAVGFTLLLVIGIVAWKKFR